MRDTPTLAGVEVSYRSLGPFLDSPTDFVARLVGKTTCLGQRLAKVEMKLLSAVFLIGTNFSAVDRGGKFLETLPRPNWNDILGCKPPKDSCFIQFEVNY